MGAGNATVASHGRIRIVPGDDGTESRRALHAFLAVQPDMAALGGAAVARVLPPELPELRVVVSTRPRSGETWTSG